MGIEFLDRVFTVPVMALLLIGVTAGVLVAYVRRFARIVKPVSSRNASLALEYWKHLIQIAAGFLVVFGLLVSGRQLQLQSDQFISKQKHEARLANNKQFYESSERLQKDELSNTEAALISFRDLLSQDSFYKRSIEIALKAALFEIATKSKTQSNGTNNSQPTGMLQQKFRRILEEYLGFFVDVVCDSSGTTVADLRGLNLSTFDAQGLVAKRADFSSAVLPAADFRKAEVECARFFGSQLAGADFTEAKLQRADFTRAQLANAGLVGADLSYADLTGASLVGARLSGATLTCTNLRGANLSEAVVDINTLAIANIGPATVLPEIITFAQIKDYRTQANLPELKCSASAAIK